MFYLWTSQARSLRKDMARLAVEAAAARDLRDDRARLTAEAAALRDAAAERRAEAVGLREALLAERAAGASGRSVDVEVSQRRTSPPYLSARSQPLLCFLFST